MHPVMPEPRYNPPHVDAVPQTRMPQPRPAPVITSTPPRHPTTPVDTRPRIAIGERLEFAGSWFTWDGRHFRNERAESELRAERIRRWRTLFFIAVVAFVAYLLIMSGLDWDRMSLEERAPYKGAGRIAVLVLLVLGVRALQNMPWTVVPDLDREVRQKYGIGLLPALGPVAPTGTGGPPRFIVPERQNYLSGPSAMRHCRRNGTSGDTKPGGIVNRRRRAGGTTESSWHWDSSWSSSRSL